MRAVKRLLVYCIVFAAIGFAIWATAPRLNWPMGAEITSPTPGDDLDAWLAQREGVFDDITDGAEKRIFWAGEPGERTELALVYLHGYSASRQEISPVSESIADALGANLFATRMAGHGRDGQALADATPTDWATDLAESMAIARRLGERVILIGTSTGGSIATLAALDPAYRDDLAALILISPNFEVNNPQAWLLDLPYARNWVPMLVGETRSWEPFNEEQARFWTTSYPSHAVFAMRTVQRAAQAADHGTATVPALIFYAAGDEVVLPAATARVVQDWGARVDSHVITDSEAPSQHVIAGDILSPSTTPFVVQTSLDWLADL